MKASALVGTEGDRGKPPVRGVCGVETGGDRGEPPVRGVCGVETGGDRGEPPVRGVCGVETGGDRGEPPVKGVCGVEEPGAAAVFVPVSQLLVSSSSKQKLPQEFSDRVVDLTEGGTGTCSSGGGATERTEGGLGDHSQTSGLAASSSGFCSASQLLSSCSKSSSTTEYEAMDSRGRMSHTVVPSSSVGGFSCDSVTLKGKGPSKIKSSKKLDSGVKQTPKLTYFFKKQVSHPQPLEPLMATKDISNPGETSSGGKAMQVHVPIINSSRQYIHLTVLSKIYHIK